MRQDLHQGRVAIIRTFSGLLAALFPLLPIYAPAANADSPISIDNLSMSAVGTQATFSVHGAQASRFQNCYDFLASNQLLLKISDDQGSRTGQMFTATSRIETLKVLGDGLTCRVIPTFYYSQYNFAPNQETVTQTFAILSGTVVLSNTTAVTLNPDLAVAKAPQIISPLRGQTLPGFGLVKVGAFDPRFTVTRIWVTLTCLESTCGTRLEYKNVKKSEYPFIADYRNLQNKAATLTVTWLYVNASGNSQSVSSSVSINLNDAGKKHPVTDSFVKQIEDEIQLNLGLTCPFQLGVNKTGKMACSMMPSLYVGKDHAALAYNFKARILYSLNGGAYKKSKWMNVSTASKTPISLDYNWRSKRNVYIVDAPIKLPYTGGDLKF